MSAPPRWTVRPAEFADRGRALELARRAFRLEAPDERGAEVWDWIFLRNPAGGRLRYFVADAGDRLAGQYAVMPVRIQHDGREALGLLSLHTMTDPDFERQGISTTLARAVYEDSGDAALVCGFPNPTSAPLLYRKLGWTELRPFPLLLRPLGGVRRLLAARHPLLAPLGALLDAVTPLLGAVTPKGGRGIVVEPFDRFGAWADELWEQLAAGLGTCVIRDAAFLNWRFCDAPFAYRRFCARRDGRIVGFAVARLAAWRGLPVLYLMELLADPSDTDAPRVLLGHVLDDARQAGASVAYTVATRRHPHLRALRRAAFLTARGPARANHSFGVRAVGPTALPERLLSIDEWYLSPSDFDWL